MPTLFPLTEWETLGREKAPSTAPRVAASEPGHPRLAGLHQLFETTGDLRGPAGYFQERCEEYCGKTAYYNRFVAQGSVPGSEKFQEPLNYREKSLKPTSRSNVF